MRPGGLAQAVKITGATGRHLPEITSIYNEAILNTTATFDFEPKTMEEQRRWMEEHDDRHPIIVAILGDSVVGWGSLSRFSDRCGYQATVEDSVYVRREFRGKGIGTMILRKLVDEARRAGHHAIIARLDAANHVSIALHRKMGFQEVGRLKEVGFKFGRWLDVVVMENLLHEK